MIYTFLTLLHILGSVRVLGGRHLCQEKVIAPRSLVKGLLYLVAVTKSIIMTFTYLTQRHVWKRAATIGCPPSVRDSHTCSSWKSKIVVIGGEDKQDYYLSDVHILDTDTFTWKELDTSGKLLTPRAGHVTLSLGRNLYVFGGFNLYVLDLDTCVWSKVLTVRVDT